MLLGAARALTLSPDTRGRTPLDRIARLALATAVHRLVVLAPGGERLEAVLVGDQKRVKLAYPGSGLPHADVPWPLVEAEFARTGRAQPDAGLDAGGKGLALPLVFAAETVGVLWVEGARGGPPLAREPLHAIAALMAVTLRQTQRAREESLADSRRRAANVMRWVDVRQALEASLRRVAGRAATLGLALGEALDLPGPSRLVAEELFSSRVDGALDRALGMAGPGARLHVQATWENGSLRLVVRLTAWSAAANGELGSDGRPDDLDGAAVSVADRAAAPVAREAVVLVPAVQTSTDVGPAASRLDARAGGEPPTLELLTAVARVALHDRQFGVAALARRVGMSPRSLERLVNRRAERTPVVWLREPRLQVADELLRQGGQVSVQDVADAVGMSRSYLTRTFTRWAGISPGEVRRQRGPGAAAAQDSARDRRPGQWGVAATTGGIARDECACQPPSIQKLGTAVWRADTT